MKSIFKDISFKFPEIKLSNELLSKEFGVDSAKIFRSTGINNRYIAAEDELASDLAYFAIEDFFFKSDVKKEDVDFLIFCSECFDFIAPNSSCILQSRLNLRNNIGVMDLPYGCSGYVYGLSIAKSLILSGVSSNVLFVTADTSTKTLPKNNIELRSIFSDAASVTFIDKENACTIGDFVFGTDGTGWENIYISRSGFRNSINSDFIKQEGLPNGKMIMNGTEIFNFGLRVVPKLVKDTLVKNNLQFQDIDLFVFHQPTKFLLDTLKNKIGIPDEKFIINIENHGNTVSATIPLALKDAEKNGKIRPGMTILLAGFGIGYSWAGTIIKT